MRHNTPAELTGLDFADPYLHPLFTGGISLKPTRKTLLPAIGLLATAMVAGHAQAQTETLFRDSFSRATNTDLNAETTGKSGSLGALDWVEQNYTGIAQIDGSNRLNIDANGDGTTGAVVYPDHNFVGLSSFEVEYRILNGNSGGDGRHFGLSIGQSKVDLEGLTGTFGGSQDADVWIGYDNIGNNTGFQIRHNGSVVDNINSSTLTGFGYPDTVNVKFTYSDMNAGSILNYEIFFQGLTDPAVSIYSNSTTWSGTDENYIAMMSNYTAGTRIQYFEVLGEENIDLPGDTDGDGDVDDADLGNAFSAYTGPLSGAAVPEPTSLALLGLGGLALVRRRRA